MSLMTCSRAEPRASTRWSLLFACVLLALSAGARADAPSDTAGEPPGYRETVEEAVQEFSAAHYEESRALFARAHALFPNARTHRGLGLTAFELRNYGEAIEQLEAALRTKVKPLSEELRADTVRLLARANNFVARLKIDAKPGSSTVLLDGLPVQVPAGQALTLQIGEHTLEVRAAGYLPETRQLSIRGGERDTVTVLLAAAPAAMPAPLAPLSDEKQAEGKPKRWYKSPWLWVGVGVVLAGTAAGVAYALTRDSEASPYGGTRDTVLQGP